MTQTAGKLLWRVQQNKTSACCIQASASGEIKEGATRLPNKQEAAELEQEQEVEE